MTKKPNPEMPSFIKAYNLRAKKEDQEIRKYIQALIDMEQFIDSVADPYIFRHDLYDVMCEGLESMAKAYDKVKAMSSNIPVLETYYFDVASKTQKLVRQLEWLRSQELKTGKLCISKPFLDDDGNPIASLPPPKIPE